VAASGKGAYNEPPVFLVAERALRCLKRSWGTGCIQDGELAGAGSALHQRVGEIHATGRTTGKTPENTGNSALSYGPGNLISQAAVSSAGNYGIVTWAC